MVALLAVRARRRRRRQRQLSVHGKGAALEGAAAGVAAAAAAAALPESKVGMQGAQRRSHSRARRSHPRAAVISVCAARRGRSLDFCVHWWSCETPGALHHRFPGELPNIIQRR